MEEAVGIFGMSLGEVFVLLEDFDYYRKKSMKSEMAIMFSVKFEKIENDNGLSWESVYVVLNEGIDLFSDRLFTVNKYYRQQESGFYDTAYSYRTDCYNVDLIKPLLEKLEKFVQQGREEEINIRYKKELEDLARLSSAHLKRDLFIKNFKLWLEKGTLDYEYANSPSDISSDPECLHNSESDHCDNPPANLPPSLPDESE